LSLKTAWLVGLLQREPAVTAMLVAWQQTNLLTKARDPSVRLYDDNG